MICDGASTKSSSIQLSVTIAAVVPGEPELQDVAELMDQPLDVVVAHERRAGAGRRREVQGEQDHRGTSRPARGVVGHAQRLHPAARPLAVATEEVEIDVRQVLAGRGVVDAVRADVRVPDGRVRQRGDDEPEHLAQQVDHPLDHAVDREVLGEPLEIDADRLALALVEVDPVRHPQDIVGIGGAQLLEHPRLLDGGE